MKYAIVNKDNQVENVVEWDGKTAYKPKGTLVKLGKTPASIGWTYKDSKFIEPKPAAKKDT